MLRYGPIELNCTQVNFVIDSALRLTACGRMDYANGAITRVTNTTAGFFSTYSLGLHDFNEADYITLRFCCSRKAT